MFGKRRGTTSSGKICTRAKWQYLQGKKVTQMMVAARQPAEAVDLMTQDIYMATYTDE